MESHGIVCSEPIIRDGVRRRFAIPGETDNNAWYKLYPDDPPAGNFGHWRMHPEGDGIKWSMKPERLLSKSELEEQNRKAAARRKQEEREEKERNALAKEKSSEVW